MRCPNFLRSRTMLAATIAAFAVLAAACGSDEPDIASPVPGVEADDDHGEFAFEPTEVEVEVDETVTFRVVNVGNLPHDFTLGDAETQDEHEAEMADMPMGDPDGHDANAVTIPAGETAEMTWTFTEAGTILMGCHIPGHYDAGMRGEIHITEA